MPTGIGGGAVNGLDPIAAASTQQRQAVGV